MPTTTNIEDYAKGYFKIQEIGLFLARIIDIVIVFGAVLTLAFLIWGAVNWIMSEGDKAKIEEARNRITAALMGLAIIATVWVIWNLVLYFFGIGEVTTEGGIKLPLPGSSGQPASGGGNPPNQPPNTQI